VVRCQRASTSHLISTPCHIKFLLRLGMLPMAPLCHGIILALYNSVVPLCWVWSAGVGDSMG
jgi:hypothetical protein